ncbi:MAG: hypothetical protein ACREBS_05660 [Nitrososphaerales archaeon]
MTNKRSMIPNLFYIPFVPNGHMTETIKVEIDEELAKRFRTMALEKYGYKKGFGKKSA